MPHSVTQLRSARRRLPMALGALVAVVLGMTAIFASNDGQAQAAPDPNQLNISSSSCVAGGAYFHFVAPHEATGTGGTLSGTYTLNGGATLNCGPINESTANNSTNAQWDVTLSGSGTFVIKTATSTGGDVYTGNGAEVGTIHCGSTTGSLTVIKTVVGGTLHSGDFMLTVKSGGTDVAGSPAIGLASPGRTYTDLTAGAYVVGEANSQGYSVGFSGDCDGTGAVTVVAGETATCTITNTFQAQTTPTTVTVTKECAGLASTAAQFQVGTFYSPVGDPIDCGDTFHQEVTGTSVVINEHNRGTAIASITCNDSGIYTALGADGYTLTLNANHDNTCTIINHAPQAATTVTVTKDCAGMSQTAALFQIGDVFSPENEPIDCGDSFHQEVTGTSIIINEHNRGGAIATISCNGSDFEPLADEGNSLTLLQNQDNACTIANHATGQLTIVKDFVGTTGLDATFTSTGGLSPASFSLDDDADGTLSNSQTFANLTPGVAFTVTEGTMTGWHLSDITCVDDSGSPAGSTVSDSGSTASVMLAAGAHVTCTFQNSEDQAQTGTATVTIAKYIHTAAGVVAATDANTSGASFAMHAVFPGGEGDYALDAGGFNGGLPYQATTSPMALGSNYSTFETGIDGTCDAGDDYRLLGYGESSVSLAAASQNLTGDGAFTNLQGNQFVAVINEACPVVAGTGQLTIVKDFVGTTGLDATFTTTGGLSPASFSLDDDADATLSNSQTFAGLSAGVAFTITEGPLTGWHVSDITCAADAGSPGGSTLMDTGSSASVTLGAGAHVTCTFQNSEDQAQTGTATVTIAKYIHTAAGLVAATDANTSGASFAMHAVFPGGEGDYALDAGGFNGGLPYQATTSAMALGSNYSTFETGIDGTCDAGDAYRLLGYGESSVSLAAASQNLTGDGAFTNLQGNQYLAVINEPCPAAAAGPFTVTVAKYVGGALATSGSFSFTTHTMASNIVGCDTAAGCDNPLTLNGTYTATTSMMAAGSNYSVSETGIDGTCDANDLYRLVGYRQGANAAAAAGATLLQTASFTDLQADGYVIVYNEACPGAVAGTGSITIHKVWDGLGTSTTGPNAEFTASGAANAVFSLTSGGSDYHINGVTSGSFAFHESAMTGWTLFSASCTGGAGTGAGVLSLATLTVNLVNNENVTCTFTNVEDTPTNNVGEFIPPTITTVIPPTNTNTTITNTTPPNNTAPTNGPTATLGVIAPPPSIVGPSVPSETVAGVIAPPFAAPPVFAVPSAPATGNTQSDSSSTGIWYLFGAVSIVLGLALLSRRQWHS